MLQYFFILLLSSHLLLASQAEIRLGLISVENNELMIQKLQPFVNYLEKTLEKKVTIKTGYDYANSIEQITKGDVDISYLGPVPYVKAKMMNPDIRIIASLDNCLKDSFQSVIVVKKDSPIKKLSDLKNKKFAFGSPNSTLSYYVPRYMLAKENILGSLKRYDFLGRHDRVAQYIIMGKYDAGAIKTSVAQEYKEYLDIIAHSPSYEDFAIVASSQMDATLFKKIQNALLSIDNPVILNAFKKGLCGFKKSDDANYDEIRQIMHNVND